MKQLNKWCKRVLTTKLFYINKVEHPEWTGWNIRKYIIEGKISFYLNHGQVSYILVIISKEKFDGDGGINMLTEQFFLDFEKKYGIAPAEDLEEELKYNNTIYMGYDVDHQRIYYYNLPYEVQYIQENIHTKTTRFQVYQKFEEPDENGFWYDLKLDSTLKSTDSMVIKYADLEIE